MTAELPGRPGAAWEAELLRVVPPEDGGNLFAWFDPAPRTTIDGMNEPSPLINRRTRRLRRKERKPRD